MTDILQFPEEEEEGVVTHCPECDNTFLHLWDNGDLSCGYCGEILLNIDDGQV